MKKYSGLVAIGAFIGLTTACQVKDTAKQESDSTAVETITANTKQELCFVKVTEGKPIATEQGVAQRIVDSLVVHLTIEKDSVTGVLNWLPSMKDKMMGTLQGTIRDSVITAIYTYQAEGQTAKEEKIFKLEGEQIRLKSGELEEQNGIWVLKDKANVPYSESAPKVACP
jgi:hypothetical protein